MRSSFVVQLITNAGGLLYAVLFHAVNAIGKLLASILDMDNCKEYDGASAALRLLAVETIPDIMLIDYLPPQPCEGFIHDYVCPTLSDAILQMPMQTCWPMSQGTRAMKFFSSNR